MKERRSVQSRYGKSIYVKAIPHPECVSKVGPPILILFLHLCSLAVRSEWEGTEANKVV